MSQKQHVIERSIYPELVNLLKSIGFEEALGESKIGQNRSFTDITFKSKDLKFLIEVKFGDVSEEHPKPKTFQQAYNYAEEKNIENFLIFVYPNELKGHVYISDEWFHEECIKKKIRIFHFTKFKRLESELSSPENSLKLLNRMIREQEYEKPSLDFLVKELQSIVKDLHKVNNYANKTKLVEEVVDKLKVFIGITGLENEKEVKEELVNLSIYLLFNQLLFYRIYRIKVKDNNLPPLEKIESISKLQNYFNLLENKGFSAIYASRILNNISESKEVVEIINDVILSLKLLRPELITHDIAGVFFHKLIPFEIRKVLATFYTVPNAADFLAQLAIKKFDDKIMDPACGSGTLLVAGYKTKEKLFEKEKGNLKKSHMHKEFLENEITGFDIMPFAGHLTAMNLALQNIEQLTDQVRIGSGNSLDLSHQLIGKTFSEGKGVKISKFEVHTQSQLTGYMDESNEKSKIPHQNTTGALSVNGKESNFRIPKQDIIIMNPPFSDIEKMAKNSPKLLKNIQNNSIISDVIGKQANLWAYFLILSDLLLKNNGIVSAVIPISIAVGGATKKIRNFMLDNYSTQYLIKPSNQDKAFSQNAFLKDILFVSKKKKVTEKDKTAIVNLKISIKNSNDEQIQNITKNIQNIIKNKPAGYLEETDEFIIRIVKASELRDKKSNIMPFFNASELTNFIEKIEKIGSNVLRKIQADDVHEGYHMSPKGTSNLICVTNPIHSSRIRQGAFMILEEIQKKSIKVKIKNTEKNYLVPISKTTNFLKTLTGVKKFVIDSIDFAIVSDFEGFDEIKKLSKWEERENGDFNWAEHNIKLRKANEYVYIASRFRPDSKNTHNFAFFSEKKFKTSDVFKALRCDSSEEGMFQTLLLNSTIGIVTMLLYRSQALGGKTNIHEEALYHFDIFDTKKLSKKQKNDLEELFTKIKDVEFPSLKEQYELNFEFRRILDLGMLNVLGINEKDGSRLLDKIYKIIPEQFTVD